ncbi:MAG: hypothetical protein IJR99_09885 [Kiritimatiellae bacterium]|nr:hypothetical protein [Kiritimatiellia bacterium]
MKRVSASVFVGLSVCCLALPFGASADVLTWNGARGAVWDASAANWLDAGNNAVSWSDGADAVFPGDMFVEVKGTVKPASISFSGNGATLVGSGRILLSGAVTAATAGTTNSIVAALVGDDSFTKLGPGAVAISCAKGTVSVAAGKLLLAGSRCENLRVSAASGAEVELLGDSPSAGNLLLNGSFEETTASGSYVYMNGQTAGTGIVDKENTAVAPWKVSDLVVLANSAGVKTWCGADSIVGTGIPDGSQLCILQRFGSIMQEVSVSEAGWYDLSFTFFKRGVNYEDHSFCISVDDVIIASVLANRLQAHWVDFSTGLVWMPAGTHEIRLTGEGWWADRATFVDNIRLTPPPASDFGVCRTLTGPGASLTAVSGASVINSFSGTANVQTLDIAAATVSGAGTLAQGGAAKVANAVSGDWSSPALWSDGTALASGGSSNFSLVFPSGGGLAWQNDLAGAFLFNGLYFNGIASGASATLSGNELSSRRDGGYLSYLYLDTPGALTISSPLSVNSNLFVNTEGDLTLAGNLDVALGEGARLEKSGRGRLTLGGSVTNVARLHVNEGEVELRNPPSTFLNYILKAPTNGTAAVYFNLSEDKTTDRFVDVFGSGTPIVGMRGGGHTMQFTGVFNCYSPFLLVDVGEGDTLECKSLTQATWRDPFSRTSLLKIGPGVFQVQEAGTVVATNSSFNGAFGSIYGSITVRDGFIRFRTDDFSYGSGSANIYTGTVFPSNRDGSLGHDTRVPLTLGDPLTPQGAVVGVGSFLAHACTTRDYIATPYPAEVVIHAVTNGIYQMATVVLQRNDLTLGGPTGDVQEVNVMLTDVTLDGVAAATVTRSGNVRTILNAASYPAGLTLVSDRMLEVGFRRPLAVSIGGLSLSGGWHVSFGSSGYDSITAANLALGPTAISLWDDVNGQLFAQSGTYTLLRYTTRTGDVSSLSIDEDSKVEGYSYTFADTGSAITLTITTADDNPVYTWIHASGGAWNDAANWDHTTAPNADTVTANFGPSAQGAATVTLGDSFALNALTFYNNNSYTLTGGTLSFGGTEPAIFVSVGDHVIQSAVANRAETPISVQSTGEGSVRFSGDVTGDLFVERGSATLSEGIDLTGNITVTGATLKVEEDVSISGTATLGQNAKLVTETPASITRIANTDDSAEIVAGDTLTLGGANSTYGGSISGSGSLVKTGNNSTLTLNGVSLSYAGNTYVNGGTLAVGAASLPGVTYLASGAALKSSSDAHGLTGHYRGYFTNTTQTGYTNQVFTLSDFQAMLATLTDHGEIYMPLATAFAIGDTRENPFPTAFAGSQNYWAAAYTANILIPESGFYKFHAPVDDEIILMIDGNKVFSSRGCTDMYGGCYLAKGIHTLYLGLLEISGNAYVSLYVMQPSETAYKLLPASWVLPNAGAAEISGSGSLAPDADTVVSVGQATGFNTNFTGSVAGQSGGRVQKTGVGTLVARYVSGDVAASGGELALYGATSFDTVYAADDSAVQILGGTIRNLFGGGKAGLGSHAYTVSRINGDADSGFSTAKTYTHLVCFPLGSQSPVINGVTVGNTGTWSWGGTAPGSSWGNDSGTAETGLGRLVYRFIHGSEDFSVTLSGLTAGKLYDWRLYFRNYATNPRELTFTFSRNGKTLGSVDWNPDTDENGKGRPYTAVGCRYVADATGAVTVRVISHQSGHKCHLYGFSNELVADVSGATDTVSLAPANGETARLAGGISGSASVSIDGVGTQILGGVNSLPGPIAVNDGKLVLEDGASVPSGVTAANGAVVELQGSAQINGISGNGELRLGLGDNEPWGALQSDGTFAEPEWPHRVNITGDADCGIAPFKTYTHLVNLGWGSTTIQQVNGVPIFCSNGSNATALYYDQHRGGTFTGAPESQHNSPGASQHNNITTDSSNAIRSFFTAFQYAGTVTLTLDRLTAGKTYEFRLYIRNWNGQNRTIDLSYNDGTTDKTFAFNEDTAPDGYIALRYTPAGTSFTLKGVKRVEGFHIYAFSNEEVGENVRTLQVDSDMAFSGVVSGNGELRKTGTGTWTFTGTGVASGAWSIEAGAISLNNSSSTTGPVKIASGASFGGIGSAGGSIGVAAGGTLSLGTATAVGALAIGGDLALGSGATLSTRFAAGQCSAVTAAGSVTLPDTLTVQAVPTTSGARLSGTTALVTAAETLSGPADFTGWSVVDANGNVIPGVRLQYGENGKTVYLSRPTGTILFLR